VVEAALAAALTCCISSMRSMLRTRRNRQRVHHGDDGGGGGELRPEAVESVEDEGPGGDRRVIVGKGVGELLLAMEVGGDGLIPLDKLMKVIIEVDHFAGLVRREELEGGEPELARCLIPGEDHVGDVLVDGGVENVEDGVVSGRPLGVGRSGGDGVINVTKESDAA
jgi:hypothetical protein